MIASKQTFIWAQSGSSQVRQLKRRWLTGLFPNVSPTGSWDSGASLLSRNELSSNNAVFCLSPI